MPFEKREVSHHGFSAVSVPLSVLESPSGYPALFAVLIDSWLKIAGFSGVQRLISRISSHEWSTIHSVKKNVLHFLWFLLIFLQEQPVICCGLWYPMLGEKTVFTQWNIVEPTSCPCSTSRSVAVMKLHPSYSVDNIRSYGEGRSYTVNVSGVVVQPIHGDHQQWTTFPPSGTLDVILNPNLQAYQVVWPAIEHHNWRGWRPSVFSLIHHWGPSLPSWISVIVVNQYQPFLATIIDEH